MTEELDVAMSQRVQSHETRFNPVVSRPSSYSCWLNRQLVAEAGAMMVLVAAMATARWQATRPRVVGLFGCRGPARQATIDLELDAHAARISQVKNSDEVRPGLTAVWRLEFAALLRQHSEVKDQLRNLIVQVCEGLPNAQQTWVRTNVIRSHNTSPLAEGRYALAPTTGHLSWQAETRPC